MSEPAGAPEVSIVIPVYNEEGIISAALADLNEKLADVDFTYEIIVAENGSKTPRWRSPRTSPPGTRR